MRINPVLLSSEAAMNVTCKVEPFAREVNRYFMAEVRIYWPI
jgi:hypothetical protein